MDQRDSCCPWVLSGEPTAKGTGLDAPAGKEDPVEFDFSLMSCSDMVGVEEVGGQCQDAKCAAALSLCGMNQQ